MALASLGGVVFRINPTDVAWNFEIITSVRPTIGGRVVQVLGATLSDITVRGYYGQEHTGPGSKTSAVLAEEFVKKMRLLMIESSKDNVQGRLMHAPIDFVVPDFGWNLKVFLKDIRDEGGAGAVTHSPDHFSYQYIIKLFPEQAGANDRTAAGTKNGVIDKKRQAAISSAVARISAGVGWKRTQFNDPGLIYDAATNTYTVKEPIGTQAGNNAAAQAAAAATGDAR